MRNMYQFFVRKSKGKNFSETWLNCWWTQKIKIGFKWLQLRSGLEL